MLKSIKYILLQCIHVIPFLKKTYEKDIQRNKQHIFTQIDLEQNSSQT